MMRKEHIFVTSLIYGKLKCEYDKDKLIDYCHDQEANVLGRNVSNRMGWQSNDYRLDTFPDDWKPIIDEIHGHVIDYYEYIGIRKNIDHAQFWINVNRKYSYNIDHDHPGAMVSGTFYLKVPKDSGAIVFTRNDNCQQSWEHVTGNNKSPESWSAFSLIPEENQLIIFPPWLRHRVDMNVTEDEDDSRISIAFNYT